MERIDATWLQNVKIGDVVTRLIGKEIKMQLKISKITQERISCGPWQFSKLTGGEIDEDIGWTETNTGSRLIKE